MGIVACVLLTLAVSRRTSASARGWRARWRCRARAAAALLLLGVTLVQGYSLGELAAVFSLTGREHDLAALSRAGAGAPAVRPRPRRRRCSARSYYDLPHNEYLRLLVEGGALGLLLYGGAVVLWAAQVAGADRSGRARLRAARCCWRLQSMR